jgi:hypothetical protein
MPTDWADKVRAAITNLVTPRALARSRPIAVCRSPSFYLPCAREAILPSPLNSRPYFDLKDRFRRCREGKGYGGWPGGPGVRAPAIRAHSLRQSADDPECRHLIILVVARRLRLNPASPRFQPEYLGRYAIPRRS